MEPLQSVGELEYIFFQRATQKLRSLPSCLLTDLRIGFESPARSAGLVHVYDLPLSRKEREAKGGVEEPELTSGSGTVNQAKALWKGNNLRLE
ncbi:hypothetical protein ACLOJK_004654 [Asimina triloba]